MDKEELLTELANKSVYTFTRSSGPGGQNINKLNTRVTIRICISDIKSLSAEEKARLLASLKHRISKDMCLSVSCQQERSQALNREIALHHMQHVILEALKIPIKRIKTKPSASQKLKRLKQKKMRSTIKAGRQIRPDTPNE